MEAELATLGQCDDPTQRESDIANAKTAAEFGVRRAQLEFYEAFSNGDLKAMERVWAMESPVRCVHPAMSSLEGREAVISSWQQLFSPGGQQGNFKIEPDRVQIDICGLTAICSCVEKTEGGGELEALNIYKREGGNWRMTLHMAGPVLVQRGKEAFF
jgi:ketosteroid isomerase-like protein